MFLVVDANVFFSALIAEGKTFRLFKFNALVKLFELTAPEFLDEELKNHEKEILEKSKLSKTELERAIRLLKREVDFVSPSAFLGFLDEARKISPPDDYPYTALALKIRSLGLESAIWSNDKQLKAFLKNKIDVFSTHELWGSLFSRANA